METFFNQKYNQFYEVHVFGMSFTISIYMSG